MKKPTNNQPAFDVDAVVAHVFRATTADSFMGLRLGMTVAEVTQALGAGTWREPDPTLEWKRAGPCGLAEFAAAMFRSGPAARSPGDLIGAELRLSASGPGAPKQLRAVAKALREELARRFKSIENKSTFCFAVQGRVNRLWTGSGALASGPDGTPWAFAKITLSDPTY